MEAEKKLIICPNCGAEIESNETKCPHCGYINIEGAEKKYMQDLGEIKENLAEVKHEPSKALKSGMSKGIKVILWTVGILLVLVGIYVAILAVEMRNQPKMFLSAEEEAYASAYRELAGEQIEEAYDNRDIEELARIFDKAYSEDRVDLWGVPHYETAWAASRYINLQKCLPNLDKKKISKYEAEEITYYCFYFYYRAYGDDGAVIFDSIRDDEIMPIITDRLGFSIEDMENFRDEVIVPPNVNRIAVYKATKKYFKQYH